MAMSSRTCSMHADIPPRSARRAVGGKRASFSFCFSRARADELDGFVVPFAVDEAFVRLLEELAGAATSPGAAEFEAVEAGTVGADVDAAGVRSDERFLRFKLRPVGGPGLFGVSANGDAAREAWADGAASSTAASSA